LPLNIFPTILSLVVISFIVFLNAIPHPFVHDDVVFIVYNPHIAHLNHWADIFLHSSNIYTNIGINSYYRPILEVLYRLEYFLFRFNAAGFHLVNVLIHIGNGLLLLSLLSRLNFSRWFAYGISLLFLIHPVQTEAVACVAGVSNLLSTFFVLLTLYAYLREKYGIALVSFALALLTKEQVIIVPFLLILLDWYQQKKNRGMLWFLFSFLGVLFLLFRANITASHMVHDILQSPGELRLRILAIPRTILMYLRLLFFPYDLHYYRNTDILAPNGLGFFGLTIVGGGLWWIVKKTQINGRDIMFGLAWFIIGLLPVLNITPLVNEYSLILTAEHFLYLPMIGIIIVAGVILKKLIPSNQLKTVGVIIALICGFQSIYQNSFWKGEISLFERMVRFEPHFGRGHLLLAKAYHNQGQEDLAFEHYHQALDIMKSYRQKSSNEQSSQFYDGFIKDINFYIGQSFMAKGQFDQALTYYREASRISPNDPVLLENMGIAYMQAKQYKEALEIFNKVLRISPQNVSVLNDMAICYIQEGDKSQAEQFLKMALGFNPSFKPAQDNLNRLMSQ
jgi:tetratricopeptide (TPR) repeat protein